MKVYLSEANSSLVNKVKKAPSLPVQTAPGLKLQPQVQKDTVTLSKDNKNVLSKDEITNKVKTAKEKAQYALNAAVAVNESAKKHRTEAAGLIAQGRKTNFQNIVDKDGKPLITFEKVEDFDTPVYYMYEYQGDKIARRTEFYPDDSDKIFDIIIDYEKLPEGYKASEEFYFNKGGNLSDYQKNYVRNGETSAADEEMFFDDNKLEGWFKDFRSNTDGTHTTSESLHFENGYIKDYCIGSSTSIELKAKDSERIEFTKGEATEWQKDHELTTNGKSKNSAEQKLS